MTAKIAWSVNGGAEQIETRELGNLPIMVKVRVHLVNSPVFLRVTNPVPFTVRSVSPPQPAAFSTRRAP
jgi:hypothetical protein